MSIIRCRLVPLQENTGPVAMAADELLLDSLGSFDLALRFYTWDKPTVSLGYFQPHSLLASNPRLAALPWIRRASGGEALVHHHELTYALAASSLVTGSKTTQFQEAFHQIIMDAIQSFGLPSPQAPNLEKKLDPSGLLCFLHHTTQDLTLGLSKIVGSAQRKRKGGLLQHGGILLQQSPHTPELPGVLELTGRSLEPEPLMIRIVQFCAEKMGWNLIFQEWSESELARIRDLSISRYCNPDWNLKR